MRHIISKVLSTVCLLTIAAVVAVAPSLTAFAAPQQNYRYVALGDSVSAGLGLPVASNSVTDQLCGRSTQAYPQQIADYYDISVENLSCSGAKVDEGIYGSQERGDTAVQPQLDAAFAEGTPNLITMTIGANDLRWTQFIRDCYLFRCNSTWDDFRAKAYLLDLRYELNAALSSIERRSDGSPPLVALSGYYDPFSGESCAGTRGINQGEFAWLEDRADDLNNVIENAASNYPFATFVPVNFGGHEICSSDPWVQDRSDVAPFHPTATGQKMIADAYIREFRQRSTR